MSSSASEPDGTAANPIVVDDSEDDTDSDSDSDEEPVRNSEGRIICFRKRKREEDEEEDEEDEEGCPVCYNPFTSHETCGRCKKQFCRACIEKWLTISEANSCPWCRGPINPDWLHKANRALNAPNAPIASRENPRRITGLRHLTRQLVY